MHGVAGWLMPSVLQSGTYTLVVDSRQVIGTIAPSIYCRISDISFDSIAGSLLDFFDFYEPTEGTRPRGAVRLFLDPLSGRVVESVRDG